jgi:SSS family transporter
MIYSFAFFLVLFVVVGLASSRYSLKTTEDYLLANKNIKPWLAGFSLFSTENSGFMFVGYIGLIYTMGVSALWIVIGWYCGEIAVLWLTARAVREHTDKTGAYTYSTLLSHWTGVEYKAVRVVSALIIVLFMCFYAAAQFSAGGKALNVLAGWDLDVSACIGFIIVLVYCLAGGIRASIWTDAVQTLVMFGSLVLMVVISLGAVGGLGALSAQLKEIDPQLVNIMAGSYKFGIFAFILGWFVAGTGILGQAHIMVRFMVIDRAENARQALYYYAFFVTILSFLCMVAGLSARVLLPDLINGDPETALPILSAKLLPGVLSGVFLAGLFAAAMSTADSQVLSSSAALTRDLTRRFRDSLIVAKIGTFMVALLALLVALYGSKSVFKLATFGWSVMGAGMAPLLFVYAIGKRPSQAHALCMMFGGVTAALGWEYAGLSGDIYNVMPGIVTGLLIYFIPALFVRARA